MKKSNLFLRFIILLVCLVLVRSNFVTAESPLQYVNGNYGFYSPDFQVCGAGVATTQLSGDDNIAKIYNYLVGKTVDGKPLQDFHVAGILGNMRNESAFNEMRLQGTPSTTRTPADSVPRGQKQKAYGLVQWDPAHKMIDPVKEAGKNPEDLQHQLDFLLSQLNGETVTSKEAAAGRDLASTTNVADATVSFETKYERHAGSPQPARIVEAERILSLARADSLKATATTADPSVTGQPVIALDPGHGGSTISRNDPDTGLHDGDYDNPTERLQVFAVAQMVKTQLEASGYRVVMTKNTAEDSVFLRDRANVANNAKAAMAVSIHTQGDKAFGTWQEIYTQKVGLYRGAGAQKQTFTDAAVAEKSQQYAAAMKRARDTTEVTSGTTVIKDNTFEGRVPIEPGNIPLVELWSQVPWIYLEAGGNNLTTGLSDQQKATYAGAIVSGVKSAVPIGASNASSTGCPTTNSAGLSATTLAYAWPEYHAAPYVTMKPEYAQAVRTAQSNRIYVGGLKYSGVDCGGFVTLLMINSGFEPNYNYGGKLGGGAGNVAGGQISWLDANWRLIGRVNSTSELQPGDVAIKTNHQHTYVYVGDIPGFGSKTASASLDERSPMAGKDDVTDSDFIWYRKK